MTTWKATVKHENCPQKEKAKSNGGFEDSYLAMSWARTELADHSRNGETFNASIKIVKEEDCRHDPHRKKIVAALRAYRDVAGPTVPMIDGTDVYEVFSRVVDALNVLESCNKCGEVF